MNFNQVILSGNLGKDPEQRTVGAGSVVTFSIPYNEKWKNKAGEQQEKTSWFDIECWGPLGATVMTYLKKGSEVLVVGKGAIDEWEKDGQKQRKFKVKADNIQFGRKPDDAKGSAPSKGAPKGRGKPDADIDDSDLPF